MVSFEYQAKNICSKWVSNGLVLIGKLAIFQQCRDQINFQWDDDDHLLRDKLA
jgi:hypothetical protein